jgi:tripartite-type tricarboxylate transporter receptor subunit TctC
MTKFVIGLALAVWCCFSIAAPNIITVTIGYAPGSGNEISFRGVAAQIEKADPTIHFVIINRPGADEVVALNAFTKLPPTGDQLFVVTQQGFTTSEKWYAGQIQYNPMDLVLVTTLSKSPLAIIANHNSQISSPAEFIKLLQLPQRNVNIGYSAAAHRLTFEYIMDQTNGNRQWVKGIQYKGSAQTAIDVASGQVEFGIVPSSVAYSLYKSGKIKYIALTGNKKIKQLQSVPLLEYYVPGSDILGAWVVALPPGSTTAQVKFYQQLFTKAINDPATQEYFENNLMFSVPDEQTHRGVTAHIKSLRKKWIPYVNTLTAE